MDYLANYVFEETEVRTVVKDIETWFAVVDVLRALGVHEKHVSRVLSRLDEDEKVVAKLTTTGGVQDAWFVSEPGLYKIMLRSHSERAEKFTRWVTHDVIPSIRKKGYYAVPSVQDHIDALIAQTEMPKYEVAERIIGTTVNSYRDWQEAKRIDKRFREIRAAQASGFTHTFYGCFGSDAWLAKGIWNTKLSNKQKSGHFQKIDQDYYMDDYIVGVIEEYMNDGVRRAE